MSLPPIHYRVVGQDDYMLVIDVAADGSFAIDSGDYTSHKPRRGTLDPTRQAHLSQLIDSLRKPRDLPAPEGAEGFVAELRIGEGASVRSEQFWEGALDRAPEIRALVRALEVL